MCGTTSGYIFFWNLIDYYLFQTIAKVFIVFLYIENLELDISFVLGSFRLIVHIKTYYIQR